MRYNLIVTAVLWGAFAAGSVQAQTADPARPDSTQTARPDTTATADPEVERQRLDPPNIEAQPATTEIRASSDCYARYGRGEEFEYRRILRSLSMCRRLALSETNQMINRQVPGEQIATVQTELRATSDDCMQRDYAIAHIEECRPVDTVQVQVQGADENNTVYRQQGLSDSVDERLRLAKLLSLCRRLVSRNRIHLDCSDTSLADPEECAVQEGMLIGDCTKPDYLVQHVDECRKINDGTNLVHTDTGGSTKDGNSGGGGGNTTTTTSTTPTATATNSGSAQIVGTASSTIPQVNVNSGTPEVKSLLMLAPAAEQPNAMDVKGGCSLIRQ